MTSIAINGFGRIGRCLFRVARGSDLQVVAINDLAPPDQLAYLLHYDSAYGRYPGTIEVRGTDLVVDGRAIPVFCERAPQKLPWRDLGIAAVAECTGAFRDRAACAAHLAAGAGRVVVSAPAKDMDLTVVLGVNEDRFDPARHHVVSNASCTTNCLAPVARVVHEAFGIVTGFVTTVHAYTSSQALVDGPARKYRRGRASAVSMIPTSTGAARATALVLPELEGKLDGTAIRVPVLTGSIVDLVVTTARDVDVPSLNEAFRRAAATERLRGILAVTEDEIVSADVVGDAHSATVDLTGTMVLGKRTAKVLAWYDNEWGYASRLAGALRLVAGGGR